MQKIKQRTMLTSLVLNGSETRYFETVIASGAIKALRATPITIAPAPGAGKILEFVSAIVALKAGANVLVEATANLGVRYKDGTGVQVSQTVETTGFIDQAADTFTYALAKIDPIVARTNIENQPLVLHNLGAGEIIGNAANDAVLRVKARYRVLTIGF